MDNLENSSVHLMDYSANFLNLSHTNVTANFKPTAKWTGMAIISLSFTLIGLVTNGGLLLIFLFEQTLFTPFNIYLINLLIVNLYGIILQNPLEVITKLYSGVWFLGETACSLWQYGIWIIQAITCWSHGLIAINRIWAVIHPISYRANHSRRLAVLLCVGLWFLAHVLMAPGLAIDAYYYRLPVNAHGCSINDDAQPKFMMLMQMLGFNLSELVIVLAFPVTFLTRIWRRRLKHRQVNVIPGQAASIKRISEEDAQTRNLVTAQETHGPSKVDDMVAQQRRPRNSSRGFVVLAWLTTSIVICWTPCNVYYTQLSYIVPDTPIFREVASTLWRCQSPLDPVMFTLALPSLRQALYSWTMPALNFS